MDIFVTIKRPKSKTHQFCFFTFNTPTAASNAIQFHIKYVTVRYLCVNQ